MNIGNYIKMKRVERNLTYSDLADKMGITPGWVRDLEDDEDELNRLNAHQFVRLCYTLGVRPNDLFEAAICDMNQLTLSDMVKKRRSESGLSLDSLARLIGYEPTLIEEIESNTNLHEVSIDALKRIASHLNIPLNAVLEKLPQS